MSVTSDGQDPAESNDDGSLDLVVRRTVDGPELVVSLHGDLDIAALSYAEREIAIAEDTAPASLVLDLSGLHFMDSSGVRLVLLVDNRARVAGRRVSVRLGDGPARRVFQTLGLMNKLPIEPARPSTVGEPGPISP